MLARAVGVVTILVVLTSCGTFLTGEQTHLTEEQLQEVQELRQAARKNLHTSLDDSWAVVAPNAHRRVVRNDNGTVTVETRAVGLEALQWLANNFWRPRLVAIDRQLTAAQGLTKQEVTALRFEREQLEARLVTVLRWQKIEEKRGRRVVTASCTPVASASATSTSSSPGAKAYANARTCEADTAFARASAWSETEDNWTTNYTYPETGQLGSVSAVKYGTPCGSSAWAEAYPLAATSDSFNC